MERLPVIDGGKPARLASPVESIRQPGAAWPVLETFAWRLYSTQSTKSNCGMPDRIEFRPTMKPSDDGSPTSFIYFDEDVELPSGETARVSFHFDRENSFDETKALIGDLKRRGVRVVIEKA